MITERTLRRWRGDALKELAELKDWDSVTEFTKERRQTAERILRLTQELLDQHLLRKVTT